MLKMFARFAKTFCSVYPQPSELTKWWSL